MNDCDWLFIIAGVGGLTDPRARPDHGGPQPGRVQPGLGQVRPLAPLGRPGQLRQGSSLQYLTEGSGGSTIGEFLWKIWGNFSRNLRNFH